MAWGRQYDYYGLAQAADYLYIMDYDANTQIWDSQCMARANSPYFTTQRGVQSYLNLGIDPSKLILGIPWYGKVYGCIENEIQGGPTSKYCPITPHNARGVDCSDNIASEESYALIMNKVYIQKMNTTAPRWDNTQKSPYFNTYSKKGETSQIWYDNPESLIYKYKYAKSMNLRGIGPFQFGDLVYDNSTGEKIRAQEMWSAFDSFFN